MSTFTCPVCGGKLKIKIVAEYAPCESCGNLIKIDPADMAGFRAVYDAAVRDMRKNTEDGFRKAIEKLDGIGFVDEAKELSAECERRLQTLLSEQQKRREFEKESEKSSTVLGVVLVVIAFLLFLAAVAGIVFVIIRMVKGTLSPVALGVVIGIAVAAIAAFIIGKLK